MAKQSKALSPNQKAIKRLLKNKPAVFGLLTIIMTFFIAIFGYYLAPDSTPNANDQISEVALVDPGFEIMMLKVRKNRNTRNTSFFGHLLYGTPSEYKMIPVNYFAFENDSLRIEIYRGLEKSGELLKGESIKIGLADIIFPLFAEKGSVQPNGDNIRIRTINDQIEIVSIADLQGRVRKEQLFKKKFYLGTDKYGRDMLSRLILGVRISLAVGFIAVIISLTIGIVLGAFAGYFGGKVDDFIMLIINTVWSIPTLLLVFAIVLALGRGVGIIFLAVGLTMWVEVARIVRGQVMALREIQFVEAAQSLGFKTWRIISKHILPNILGPVMVVAAANFATAILIEAGLSYLGFGIQPPTPSWGNMLNENYGMAIGGKPLLALIPALAIMLMVLAFNLVGNGFRDALDVKTKI